ncbi:hypothetical protein BpHYR1_033617 [Brachionus plicatilis]|uniref:Uncharacterized protein n=1 Tax=Brachionus plicatilis TaxID=10195 RepID=A0A3M7QK47_BRAPC|nr:hypothetical protein BpHYR1_033617 [Brachionus plicatilis]
MCSRLWRCIIEQGNTRARPMTNRKKALPRPELKLSAEREPGGAEGTEPRPERAVSALRVNGLAVVAAGALLPSNKALPMDLSPLGSLPAPPPPLASSDGLVSNRTVILRSIST